eukprot:763942-Hanusia_phi.AAC.3
MQSLSHLTVHSNSDPRRVAYTESVQFFTSFAVSAVRQVKSLKIFSTRAPGKSRNLPAPNFTERIVSYQFQSSSSFQPSCLNPFSRIRLFLRFRTNHHCRLMGGRWSFGALNGHLPDPPPIAVPYHPCTEIDNHYPL